MLFVSLKLIHLLSILIWVGGMFFAHVFLRPAAQALPAPERIQLMYDVLRRFFTAVAVIVVLVLLTGVGMIGSVHSMAAAANAKFQMPVSWMVMSVFGLIMMAVFGHLRFALFKRLQRAVAAKDWPSGGKALASIRQWVAFNLALGLVTIMLMRIPIFG